ncbi:flagellar filament capping protein FliD [Hathewaya massiliensis]|uniref:flagellar filament capping protein FliD n=1 Tax=Hathewaya massiliensis TaxID=1964382 RepID=UPI00115A7E04|nr:flagellar filament capping protein FliD [Hathewaya massiliensis]
MANNYMRLTGLATGLDTDNMIKQMMKPYNMKVDKLKSERQSMQWKQDIYRDIIKDVNKLNYDFLDVLGSEKNVTNLSGYNLYEVADKTGSSVSVNTGVNVQEGRYEVKVDNIATPAKIESDKFELEDYKNFKLGEDKTLKIKYKNGAVEVTKDIALTKDSSLSDIFNKIKQETKGEVVAKYSELTKKITFETKATGKDTGIEVTDAGIFGVAFGTMESGKDANFSISIPGSTASIPKTSSTNTFTADGITYNFVKNGTTEFTLGKNVDKAYDKIKGFVDEYNKLIDKISGKVGEKKDYSFKPLSEEQRKELKDDEIKKWDEKAKLGLLRGDSDLQNMLNNLRKAFFQNVEGINVRFGDKLGISTSSDYLKGGKIEINESKFKQALRDDSEGVLKLFTKISDTPYSAVDKDKREKRYSENGIFQRVKDVFLDYTRTLGYGSDKKGILIEKAGIKDEYGSFNEFKNYISEQMKEKDKVIFNLEKDLGRRENKYYMQFAQLEKMMNKMNSQSSWLMSQLGTGAQ